MESNEEDYTFFLLGIICVTVNFKMLSKFYFPAISRKMDPKYDYLEPGQKRLWDTYMASTFHSLITASCSIYFLLFDQHLNQYPHGPADSKFKFLLCFSAGYFLHDVLEIIRCWKMFGKWSELSHHFISFVGTVYVIVCGRAAYVTCVQLFHEFSTPFVNIRWFMLTAGVDKSETKYKVVSLSMLITFFICRIATIPLFWMTVYPDCFFGDAYCNVPEIKILFFVFFGLDILNLYWFKLMLRILFSFLKNKIKEVPPTSDESCRNTCVANGELIDSEYMHSIKKKL